MQYLTKLRRKFDWVELYDKDLDDYQRDVVKLLKENPKFAVFIDTGLGKTAICLRLIRDLIDADRVKNVLIIAPLKVANQTWGDEIRKWEFSAPLSYKLIRAEPLVEQVNRVARAAQNRELYEKDFKKIERKVNSRVKKHFKENPAMPADKHEQFVQTMRDTVTKEYRKHLGNVAKIQESGRQIRAYEREQPTHIHIINQEMVEWLVNAWGSEDWIYDCVIFDESDALKDASTKRWKALASVSHKCKHFYQLTATPAAENYLGLYAQIKLLDGGARLGRTMTDYKTRFFDINPYNYQTTLKSGAADKIASLIADISIVMKQEDYLKDIPPYVIENISYSLPDKAREYYQDMSKKGLVTIDGVQIFAEQAVSAIQKMMQICAGFIYDSEETISDFGSISAKRKIYPIHTAKIEALKALMARFPDDNFLISYYHQGSLELLQKHFPEVVKMDRAGSQKSAWNDGKIKMLLMHPKSGAHGLNLQKGGRIVINYDVYFSYGQFYQFLRRLARRGQQAKEVLVFNLLAEKTYDEYVASTCWQDKGDAQAALFNMITEFKKGFKNGKSEKK